MYSDIDAYVGKVNTLMKHDFHHPKIFLKKHDHKILLHELKINYTKIIDDLNILDMHNLAICTEYVFDKLEDCLGMYFDHLLTCVQNLNEQTTLNHTRYVYQTKCSECQKNVQKNKVESLINSMTLGDDHPNFNQIHTINRQIDDLQNNYESNELSLMINQVLQRKQTILNGRNAKINNIYDEIAQYLQNIPQATISMSKQKVNKQPASQYQIENYSLQFSQNFGQIFRVPIKKLIQRILSYAKKIYCKKKQANTVHTQTLLIKDEQNIKMLLKNNDILKKQLDMLKKIKRQSQRDMVKLLNSQQKNAIRIHQLVTQNTFLHEKYQKLIVQLNANKLKLQITQNNKKQMGQKLVKDYTTQKAHFLRTIRQLELKIQSTSHQIKRLRKQTQGSMTSQNIQTTFFQSHDVQIQTDQRCNASGFLQIDSKNATNNSRRNGASKISNGNRRSDNNDSVNQNGRQSNYNLDSNILQNQYQKLRNRIKPGKIMSMIQKQDIFMNQKLIRKQQKHATDHTQHQDIKARQSTVDRLNIGIQKLVNQNRYEMYHKPNNGQDKKYQLLINQQNQGSYQVNQFVKPCFEPQQIPQLNFSLLSSKVKRKQSRQKDRQLSSRQNDNKKFELSGQKIKIQSSSRMFLPKPHCSPYIGSSNLQTNWLGLTQAHHKKCQTQVDAQKRLQQNSQKIKFISILSSRYSKLKQKGLINKIQQLVSIQQNEQFNKKNQFDKYGSKQKFNRIESRRNQKLHKNKYKSLGSECLAKISPFNIAYIKQQHKLQFFTKKQVNLLFDSIQNAKKYELNQDIWQCLDRSIMVDYCLMTLSNNVQVFFTHLRKNQPIFYLQCAQFLQKPHTYLKIRKQSKNSKSKLSKNNSVVMSTNIQNNLNKLDQYKQNRPSQTRSAQQLRCYIHKILRYHKIAHRKCNHVQQFLTIVGFKTNEI